MDTHRGENIRSHLQFNHHVPAGGFVAVFSSKIVFSLAISFFSGGASIDLTCITMQPELLSRRRLSANLHDVGLLIAVALVDSLRIVSFPHLFYRVRSSLSNQCDYVRLRRARFERSKDALIPSRRWARQANLHLLSNSLPFVRIQ